MESIKKSNGEEITRKIFKETFDLKLEKIPKSNNETADFYTKKGNQIVAVCEVKDIDDPNHHYLTLEATHEEETRNAERIEKGYRSRIRDKAIKASNQLKQYDYPKILTFVSFDIADIYDFRSLLPCLRSQGLDLDLTIWITVDYDDKKDVNFGVHNNNGRELHKKYFQNIN